MGPTGEIPGQGNFTKLNEIVTVAKITLSDVDNKRGYEMTVTGSGFNDGTSASVYVLHIPGGTAAGKWDALDCERMKDAVGMDDDAYCEMYAGLTDTQKATVRGIDYTTGAAEIAFCRGIIANGTEVGGALVGSDDKVAVTFEVTAPTFGPGNTNYICMVDGEGRMSNTDVEDFNLEPSIKVVPATVNSGDTVNVFAQDFSNRNEGHAVLKIAGQVIDSRFITDREPISIGGDGFGNFRGPRRL